MNTPKLFHTLLLPAILCLCTGTSCWESDSNSEKKGGESVSVLEGFDESDPVGSLLNIKAGPSSSTLHFPIKSKDLGKVYQLHEYPLEFEFEIQGKDDMIVTALNPSCGCTDARLMIDGQPWSLGKAIPGGSKGKIAATFNGERYTNIKTSKIEIKGNGANLPLNLSLKANVHPIFKIKPNKVDFGKVLEWPFRDVNPEAEVMVAGKDPFSVKNWRTPAGITVEDTGRVEPTVDGEGQRRWFKLKLQQDAPARMVYGTAVGETDIGFDVEIACTADVVGPVKYLPEQRLQFGTLEVGQTAKRLLKILGTTQDIAIPEPTFVIEDEGIFAAKLEVKKPDREMHIVVSVKPEVGAGRHRGILKVRFPAESGFAEKQVQLYARVK